MEEGDKSTRQKMKDLFGDVTDSEEELEKSPPGRKSRSPGKEDKSGKKKDKEEEDKISRGKKRKRSSSKSSTRSIAPSTVGEKASKKARSEYKIPKKKDVLMPPPPLPPAEASSEDEDEDQVLEDAEARGKSFRFFSTYFSFG